MENRSVYSAPDFVRGLVYSEKMLMYAFVLKVNEDCPLKSVLYVPVLIVSLSKV